jgi:hypothetical protein
LVLIVGTEELYQRLGQFQFPELVVESCSHHGRY